MVADMLPPRAAVARAKAEGISISETAIRRWIKTGEIHAVYSGNKALIYFPTLAEYATGVRYERRIAGESA